MLLKNVNYESAKLHNNFLDDMRKDPLLTAIHFEKRFNALIKILFYQENNLLVWYVITLQE